MSESNALKLLTEYGEGSDSEDEVPSGRLPVKRLQHFSEESKTKNVRLPSPNITCLNLVQPEDGPSDETSKHDGKIRSFPHERGNWATYLYVPYEPENAMTALISKLTHLVSVDIKSIDHFHISLSKTVILRHHWIESFVQDIRDKIIILKSFVICFDGIAIYTNEEKSRTFIGLKIKSGFDTLVKLVNFVDDSLSDFNLPTFYKSPSFHMSIAWTLGDNETYFNKILPQLNVAVQEVFEEYPEEYSIFVNNIQCKCGNKLYNFNLS